MISLSQDKNLKKTGKAAERRAAIRKVISQRFDFEEMARRSLAVVVWQQRTPQELKRVRRTLYRSAGALLHEENRGIQQRKDCVSRRENRRHLCGVQTKIITDRNVEIPIDYRLLDRNGKWLVYDVVIEGVSLVNNYRTQFSKIIADQFVSGAGQKDEEQAVRRTVRRKRALKPFGYDRKAFSLSSAERPFFIAD